MNFLICILFIAVVLSYSDQCSVNFVPSNCQHEMFCTNSLENMEWQMFLHHDESQQYGKYDVCSTIQYVGYNFEPIHLVYKQTQIDDPTTEQQVPSYQYEDESIDIMKHIIYSLDLSGDNYEIRPAIADLQNLAILNLSNNQLTTAVLSNVNQLNSLTDIDLSYNTISDIKVNSYEYPYSTLKNINMSHNYLVKIPDAVFDKNDDLQTLDLSHNYIESLNHFTFEGIKNLLHLNLSSNRLSDINSSFFRFSKLKDLNLSGNRIKDLKVSDFEKLNRLEYIDLSSNLIKTIDFNAFSIMLSLFTLDLNNNAIEALNKDSLLNLVSLSSINLSKNKLTSLPQGLFKHKNIYTFSISENFLEGALRRGMFEGINVTKLDLSNQLLTGIEDYAFNDLIILNTLLLNNNAIQSLSNMCFRSLVNLQELDLSSNKISSLDFSKTDLTNLQSLLLGNNRLVHIKSEHFHDLISLEYLDLSENSISGLNPDSFKSLRNLVHLEISENPLSGILETSTFDGLVSIPSLDISRTLLTTVQNASFYDMNELKELNMSRSKIKELQFNTFAHTGNIEMLDLSYNKLESLHLNMTELTGLKTFLINNNLLKSFSPTLFHGLARLNKISLAHNFIENIHNESLSSLTDLRFLDLSYNEKFNFAVKLLEKCKNLNTLILSGIKTHINFANIEDNAISELDISNAGIHNISDIYLKALTRLNTLVLSNNNISKVDMDAFTGIDTLRYLDLSLNNIYYIQPGTFKDNEFLYSLNVSHNSLSAITYGVFRGLIHLNTLDMSYNNIKDLQNERFYEVNSLSKLIVDHNEIHSVDAEEFKGTRLSILSIGDNPLPCRILIKLKKNRVPFEITAINKDEHSGDNIDGVTCNKGSDYEVSTTIYKGVESNDVLVDVRNILYNISNKNNAQHYYNDAKYLVNMTKLMEKSNIMNNENLLNLANLSSRVIDLNNSTNVLLKKILTSLQSKQMLTTTPLPLTEKKILKSTENKTIDPIPYINEIKIDLEKSIANEKLNILNELERKFSLIHYQTEGLPTSPSNDKLVSAAANNESSKSLFTETCVALILLILVALVLYKFYKSRMFVRSRLSFSTRELPGAMDNSTL